MGKAIRWTMVWLFAAFTALLCVSALVQVERFEPAVTITEGTEQTFRFASAKALQNVQSANKSKKLTVVVKGAIYVTSYAISNEEQSKIVVFDSNLPSLTDGTTVMIKIAKQTLLQKTVGL